MGCEVLGMPCGMQFPCGGGGISGCTYGSGSCGGMIYGWTKDPNGNILGQGNGEQLCPVSGACLYWDSWSYLWEDKPTWILRQAGARSDPGAKAAMAVTAPAYAVMGAVAGVEAADTALTVSRNIPLSPQNIGRLGDVIQGATPGSVPATGGGILGACLSGGCAELWRDFRRLF
jgi:hypothetical protein